ARTHQSPEDSGVPRESERHAGRRWMSGTQQRPEDADVAKRIRAPCRARGGELPRSKTPPKSVNQRDAGRSPEDSGVPRESERHAGRRWMSGTQQRPEDAVVAKRIRAPCRARGGELPRSKTPPQIRQPTRRAGGGSMTCT